MRSEKELMLEISRIGRESTSLAEAVEAAQSLLAREIGSATLLIDPAEPAISSWAAKSASDFLDSRKFPFRALYTAPLAAGNLPAGRLIACFGSFETAGDFLPRLAGHIAQQFGPLLSRTYGEVGSRAEAA
jgi:hypothetical protein